jgi:hypothetical protein
VSDPNPRATDPGVRLFQLERLQWVHCPRCDGPARKEYARLACLKCPYREGPIEDNPRRMGEVVLRKWSPSCSNPSCGAPIPKHGRAVRRREDGELLARVVCPTCGHGDEYPALPASPAMAARAWARIRHFWSHPLYLRRSVGGHTLYVYNLEHLEMLEQWLGAKLRERGPSPGLTMMARLPRWMKSASMRPKVLKALADIREQALREGLS